MNTERNYQTKAINERKNNTDLFREICQRICYLS